MSKDPYGDAGGFTPYEPDARPEAEPAPEGSSPSEPYVPYAGSTTDYRPAVTSSGRRAVPWIIGVLVLALTCGGGATALVASIVANDDTASGSEDDGVYTNDLKEDQCLIGAGLDPGNDDPVSDLEVVDCATAHDAEVIAVKVLDADEAAAYDFEDDNGAVKTCRDLFNPAEMKLLNRPELYLIALTESAEPVRGDKVACLLVRQDGGVLHGSLTDPGTESGAEPS